MTMYLPQRGLFSHWTVWGPLLAMMLATATVLAMLLWVVWPQPPLTFNKLPLPIHGSKVVRAGDAIEYVLDYCRATESHGWVGGGFASGGVTYPLIGAWAQMLPGPHSAEADALVELARTTLPPDEASKYEATIRDGCFVIHEAVVVPSHLPPGSYKFYLSQIYQPTIVFPQRIRVETEAFEVIR